MDLNTIISLQELKSKYETRFLLLLYCSWLRKFCLYFLLLSVVRTFKWQKLVGIFSICLGYIQWRSEVTGRPRARSNFGAPPVPFHSFPTKRILNVGMAWAFILESRHQNFTYQKKRVLLGDARWLLCYNFNFCIGENVVISFHP